MSSCFGAVLALLFAFSGFAMADTPDINPRLLTERWSAHWIAPAGVAPHAIGVYHFRRAFELPERPARFVIHVTADQRYELHANGVRVCSGPARGDLTHWNYETVDLAPRLHAGKNVLAVVVWNFGEDAPMAQVTSGTGFLLQGDTATERAAETGAEWKCDRDDAYSPIHYTHGEMRGYFVAGPGERIDAARYPWGWQQAEFDDSGWSAPVVMTPGCPRMSVDAPNPWMLVPRSIPAMEERPERIAILRKAEGITPPAGFPATEASFMVPAHSKARLVLDNGHLTTAYPELILSGGAGATVSLGYAETFFSEWTRRTEKGNRNEVEGKEFRGYRDVFLPDGGAKRLFRPLWWRTYRYMVLDVETGDEPVTIEDLRGIFTAFPFERKAELKLDSPDIQQILDVGWRTARLCAHETYMDCPYYEQLQYVGDTRVQAMISLYTAGDARLMKNAIAQIDRSRTAEGATMSRAPTRMQQYIPSFSLFWIGMLHDYWMYVDDPAFVKDRLPGVRAVLSFFARYQKSNRSLDRLPWWRYVDATNGWPGGSPPEEADGSSAPHDLLLLQAYGWAAEMEAAMGSKALAGEDRAEAKRLRKTIQELYWDSGRRLYADTPRKQMFSQHTNALAALAGLVEGDEARDLIGRVLEDRSLVQCAFFFKYYLHAAVNRVGLGDRYLDLLEPWREMLRRGLTTWAETSDAPGQSSRSDCHAWSAHPNFELFRTVLGIDTAAPGFRRVIIRPFLGKLAKASGAIPHPRGMIRVALKRTGAGLDAEIELPEGVTGELLWNGLKVSLPSGQSHEKL